MNSARFHSLSVITMIVLIAVSQAVAQPSNAKEKVLFSFPASGDVGNSPNGFLISDTAGNFYGVTSNGGLGSGAVYELSPTADGVWTAKSIYEFPTSVFFPGELVMDYSGNLFGTLYGGGTGTCTDGYGNYPCGSVYELSPDGAGGWSEKTIWNFGQTEGWRPWSLTIDSAGNLYGTTIYSGLSFGGAVYELQREGENWNYTVLHAFGQAGSPDGAEPQGPLVFDKSGNIYGTTYLEGSKGGGTAFELKKTDSGWQEINLFQFEADGSGKASGYNPGNLIMDSIGNLYGSTFAGGVNYLNGFGVVYELAPTDHEAWKETVLHKYQANRDGYGGPGGGLVLDSAGNLYGTSAAAGAANAGNVFELKRSANHGWTYSVLHTFQGGPNDGAMPDSTLLLDSKGNLYGTTSAGGTAGVGTVFEITP